jgi:hypothetical protein
LASNFSLIHGTDRSEGAPIGESFKSDPSLTSIALTQEEMADLERKLKQEAQDKARLWALYTRLHLDKESSDDEEEEDQTGDPSKLQAQEQAEFLRLKAMYPEEIGTQKERSRKRERKAAFKSFELQLRQKARELGITEAQLMKLLEEAVEEKRDNDA